MGSITSKQLLLFAFIIATWLAMFTEAEPRWGFDRKRDRPPPPLNGGPPPPGPRGPPLPRPGPRGPKDCAVTARHFSRMSLMGGWRRVNVSDASAVSSLTIDLAKLSVLKELRRVQKLEEERPRPPPRGGHPPPPPLPSLDLASSKINPVEAFTQVVAGINTCAVFTVSECVEKLCNKPVIQCSAKVYTGFMLVRGEPAASVEDVHCIPLTRPKPRKQPNMKRDTKWKLH